MTRAGRQWGFWTRAKLGILSDYLDGFVTASSGQAERVYLDAFAGEPSGLDRLTGERFKGSARVALDAKEPGFTRFRFFEKGQKASELEATLRATYPGRDLSVVQGDCNETIPRVLSELSHFRWAPTFAFLDPDGMELSWRTLGVLADHKKGYRKDPAKPEYKVELWMLFPSGGLMRTLALDEEKLNPADEQRATRLFGDPSWRRIYDIRRTGDISGGEAREEYVNLMRWRLERNLGYRWSYPLEVRNAQGNPLYHMIFVTDHEAGTHIMEHVYRNAAKEFPVMQKEARDRARGQLAFDIDPDAAATYRYEPPWEPPNGQAEI